MTRRVLALCALLAMPAATASAAPFTNGSFELASVNPGGVFVTLGAGSTDITGWVVIGGSVDYIGGYWEAADGNRSVDLSGNTPSGGVEQTFDTLLGQDYLIGFALAGNPDGPPATKTVQVTSGALVQTFTFTIPPGTSRADMNWADYSFLYTAVGPSTTLSFLSNSGTLYGPALDDVTVSAVPEPATMSLLGLGLAVAAARRRFRR